LITRSFFPLPLYGDVRCVLSVAAHQLMPSDVVRSTMRIIVGLSTAERVVSSVGKQ
jgi:hypothetical protein